MKPPEDEPANIESWEVRELWRRYQGEDEDADELDSPFLEQALAYAEDRLSPEEMADVEARMQSDPEFSALVTDLCRIQSTTPQSIPDGLADKVLQTVPSPFSAASSPAARTPTWQWAVAAAVVLSCAYLGFVQGVQTQDSAIVETERIANAVWPASSLNPASF